MDLSYQAINAQSWFVASELIRRHPDLLLIETHPGGGQYDCLSIWSPRGAKITNVIDLNRRGSMHVHAPAVPRWEPIPWVETVKAGREANEAGVEGVRDSHDVVKRLEAGAGVTLHAKAPSSSPAALSYRVIARVLAGLLNDRGLWDVRNERADTSGYGGGDRGHIQGFPSARQAALEVRPSDLFGVATYRYWALLRNGTPVAILDTDGKVHLRTGIHDLPFLYKECGRSITAVVGRALGSVLP